MDSCQCESCIRMMSAGGENKLPEHFKSGRRVSYQSLQQCMALLMEWIMRSNIQQCCNHGDRGKNQRPHEIITAKSDCVNRTIAQRLFRRMMCFARYDVPSVTCKDIHKNGVRWSLEIRCLLRSAPESAIFCSMGSVLANCVQLLEPHCLVHL